MRGDSKQKRDTHDEFGQVLKPTRMVLEVLGDALIALIVGGLCLFVLGNYWPATMWNLNWYCDDLHQQSSAKWIQKISYEKNKGI